MYSAFRTIHTDNPFIGTRDLSFQGSAKEQQGISPAALIIWGQASISIAPRKRIGVSAAQLVVTATQGVCKGLAGYRLPVIGHYDGISPIETEGVNGTAKLDRGLCTYPNRCMGKKRVAYADVFLLRGC